MSLSACALEALEPDPIDRALVESASMFRSPRMVDASETDAVAGDVHWSPAKSLWLSAMTVAALIGGPIFFTWGAFVLFLATTAITVCLGHSLGMHRRLIHRAFDCPLWLERMFRHAGRYGRTIWHDPAARHPRLGAAQTVVPPVSCPPLPSPARRVWQLHCELRLLNPPQLQIESRVFDDAFYRFIDRTFMAQQLPWALLFFAIGDVPWLIWGIAARIAASVTGHWLVGYFAHNRGPRSWHIAGAGVQGYNVPYCGLITMGEAWHNNHHAFPASARLGLRPGENDPGWWVLLVLSRIGLVWNLKTPDVLPKRPNLIALAA